MFSDLSIVFPNFVHIAEGRDVWEIFFDENFLGNSRVGPCSKKLKRELLWKWIKKNYLPDECIVHLGIDWSEIHRMEKVRDLRKPYRVTAPLCFKPFLNKQQIISQLKEAGIKIPRLYDMGFPHNNCGGFCVKAGQAQFKLLLEKFPERYKYHEEKEQQIIHQIGKPVSILRRQKNKVKELLPLKQFREEIEAGCKIDAQDWGGCGCAID